MLSTKRWPSASAIMSAAAISVRSSRQACARLHAQLIKSATSCTWGVGHSCHGRSSKLACLQVRWSLIVLRFLSIGVEHRALTMQVRSNLLSRSS